MNNIQVTPEEINAVSKKQSDIQALEAMIIEYTNKANVLAAAKTAADKDLADYWTSLATKYNFDPANTYTVNENTLVPNNR